MKSLYLVSQDLWALFVVWAQKTGFLIPNKRFFGKISQGIAHDLQEILKDDRVRMVSFDRLRDGMKKKVLAEEPLPTVSLDRVYLAGDYQLDINRVVCFEGNEWKDVGEQNRPGTESLECQIDFICSNINGRDVIIVDDGCWTGGSISRVVGCLSERGLVIKKVLVGILISGDSFSPNFILDFVFRFPSVAVKDWICERDFFPGAPLGGRTVVPNDSLPHEQDVGIGAYYLMSMGDYRRWASLDVEEEAVRWFSKNCVKRSIQLFQEIEKLSKRPVLMDDLPRLPYGIDFKKKERFIDVLSRL